MCETVMQCTDLTRPDFISFECTRVGSSMFSRQFYRRSTRWSWAVCMNTLWNTRLQVLRPSACMGLIRTIECGYSINFWKKRCWAMGHETRHWANVWTVLWIVCTSSAVVAMIVARTKVQRETNGVAWRTSEYERTFDNLGHVVKRTGKKELQWTVYTTMDSNEITYSINRKEGGRNTDSSNTDVVREE